MAAKASAGNASAATGTPHAMSVLKKYWLRGSVAADVTAEAALSAAHATAGCNSRLLPPIATAATTLAPKAEATPSRSDEAPPAGTTSSAADGAASALPWGRVVASAERAKKALPRRRKRG
eukprot:scaffold547_cov384-Prasinococcus_capsulatus_cf.AAC.19